MKKLHTSKDLEKAFKKWNGPLYRYTYVRLRNKNFTEDIIQEVFIKAWKYRDSFDIKKSSLKNWLFAITINTIRDYLRQQSTRTETSLDEDIEDTTDTAKQTEEKDMVDFVFQQIHELSEREQELILLSYKEDLNIREIADILGMKYSATKVALHRATKKLKDICNENVTNRKTP